MHKLVYYEETDNVYAAISREKKLKNGVEKKDRLIIKKNPDWRDLSENWE